MGIIMKKSKKSNWDDCFGLNRNKELCIYYRLCRKKLSRKQKKMISGFEFNTYAQWKKYLVSKYEVYDSDALNELSRYFGFQIRKQTGFSNVVSMFLVSIVSICMTRFIGLLYDERGIYNYESVLDIICKLLCWVTGCIFLAVTVFWLISVLYTTMWGEEIRKNFYEDFKEIIDELIRVKKESLRDPDASFVDGTMELQDIKLISDTFNEVYSAATLEKMKK